MSIVSSLQTGSFRHPTVLLRQRWPSEEFSPSLSIESVGGRVFHARDVEIYGEREPAEYLYKVVSGAVRTYKVLVDGRRQICAFHLCGDCFGLETAERRAFSAETITDSTILVIKRNVVMALAERDTRIARELWAMTLHELRLTQAHLSVLIKTAKERVAAFLLEMAERMSTADQVDLPMSRQDIADYLGLTIETISRTLTDLENEAAISLSSSRRVELRDRNSLSRYCN